MAEQTMRAVVAERYGDPDVLKVTRLPVPEPGPGAVRLRVAYVSLNPVDVFARQGRWAAPLPLIPGVSHDGVVEKLGAGVDAGWLGKRVQSSGNFGGCADYSIAKPGTFSELPAGIDWKVGAVWRGMVGTAWHSVHTAAQVQAGQTVVIHAGAGAIGIVMTQIAREKGATVIALCGGPAKIAFARPYGAQHFIDYRATDWVPEVMRLTNGRGADVILDGNGGPDTPKNYDAIAPNGLVLVMGATEGREGRGPDVPVDLLMKKSFKVGAMSLNALAADLNGRDDDLMLDAVRSGRWKIPITDVVELEDVPALHARFERRETMGRPIIRVGGDL